MQFVFSEHLMWKMYFNRDRFSPHCSLAHDTTQFYNAMDDCNVNVVEKHSVFKLWCLDVANLTDGKNVTTICTEKSWFCILNSHTKHVILN